MIAIIDNEEKMFAIMIIMKSLTLNSFIKKFCRRLTLLLCFNVRFIVIMSKQIIKRVKFYIIIPCRRLMQRRIFRRSRQLLVRHLGSYFFHAW